jgi:putative ABC transport system substrate-binding protein
MATVGPIAAVGQQPREIPRIGVLMGSSPSVEAEGLDAFREALEKFDYIDGQTILIEMRYAMGQPDRLSSLARELVAMAPSVIVCVGRQETTALQAATRTIPIVFRQVNDPVEQGLVASLARPGGNTTGFTQMSAELDPKRLELLHEIAPSLSRAAFLVDPNLTPGLQERVAGAEAAASSLGIRLAAARRHYPGRADGRLGEYKESSNEALLVQSNPMFTGTEFSRILDFALAQRLPTVFEGLGGARAATDTAATRERASNLPPAALVIASGLLNLLRRTRMAALAFQRTRKTRRHRVRRGITGRTQMRLG